jgi:radical SAM superfamily enzyme YgiQ (UPF0313 family)
MKILLISPPVDNLSEHLRSPPLGLGYIASVLQKNNYHVKIADMFDYSWKEVSRKIKKEDADIVGISCFTWTRIKTFNIAKIAKQYNPNVKIIMGGSHATFLPHHIFQLSPTDVVVLGEGEITALEVIKALDKGKELSKVKGIVFKRKRKLIRTGLRPFIKNLDILPFPSYNNFELKRYNRGSIITSRGCPFSCQFCSASLFWGRCWRSRSTNNVVDEIEYLNQELGIQHLYMFDDSFTVNRKRVIEICKEILKRKIDIVWYIATRVDLVDKEMLGWCKKAGCREVDYGIESGSPLILKTINKGFTVPQIRKAFKISHEVGLETCACLMVGNPNESRKTIDETIKLVKEIKPTSFQVAPTTLHPATPLYNLAKSKGIISDDYWLTDKPVPFYTAELSLAQLYFLKHIIHSSILKERSTPEYLNYILKNGTRSLFNKPNDLFSLGYSIVKDFLKDRL